MGRVYSIVKHSHSCLRKTILLGAETQLEFDRPPARRSTQLSRQIKQNTQIQQSGNVSRMNEPECSRMKLRGWKNNKYANSSSTKDATNHF